MPPVDPNSVNNQTYQVRVKWLEHGQYLFNVFHFKSIGSQPIIDQLLTVFLGCLVDSLLPVLASECKLLGLDCKNVGGGTAMECELDAPADTVGELTSQALPSTITVSVGLRTEHPGRSGRGRFALPGISEEHVAQGQYDAPFDTALQAFLDCLATAFFVGDPPASNQFLLGVWSKKDTAFYPAVSFKKNPVLGTMRTRKIGRGI